MLSRNDYIGYLKEMIDIEQKMKKLYWDLEEKINDPEIKNFFSRMIDEETGHAKIMEFLVEFINRKYPAF